MGRLALWLGGIRRLLSALLLLVTPPLAALETVDGVRTLRSADVQQVDYPTVQAVHAMGQSLHRQSGGKLAIQVYSAALLGDEATLLQLTRSAALDLAADGIRVNAVSPGWTWSGILDQISGGDRDKVNAVAKPFHMLGRIGDPAEVADAVLFLCSDHARFITGTNLAVDGGYAALGPEQALSPITELMS